MTTRRTNTHRGKDSRIGGELTDVPIPQPKSRSEKDRRYRSSDKGKAKEKRYRQTPNAREARADREYLVREFIAYDGEGINDDVTGKHLYTLFASSHGIYMQHDNGLATTDLFDAVLNSKRQNPEAIHVIYGGSYDFNMFLTDVPIRRVNQLYETGSTLFMQYRIQWRRGKSLRITDRDDRATVILYDVVSFFQRPFVQACDEYLGDAFIERDMIVKNKASRGTFDIDDNDEVRRYNHAELVNLVNLMTELRLRLHKVQLRPRRWDGPGAIATALMQRENIKASMSDVPPRIAEGGRYAYFGGRFEMLKVGDVQCRAFEYDINSAYPSALRHVPNLSAGHWTRAKVPRGYDDFAIFRVRWEMRASRPDWPHPLPCRTNKGNVWYPRNVEGWYWAPEVLEAEFDCGGELTILEGWRFVPDNPNDKPFSFIEPMYLKRQALKKAGDGAQVGLKLALNSLYGKTCQRIGYSIRPDGTFKIPPFHQLEWAGFVTSHCRATIYNAAKRNLDSVIAFETDALFVEHELDLDVGTGLGQWDYTAFDHLAYCQSGFYFGEIDGKPFAKTRGVDRGSVTYDNVRGKFWTNEPWIDASLTRFNGVGIARMRNNWELWRTWEKTPKRVTLDPVGKRQHFPELCYACESGLNIWHTCIVPCADETMYSQAFPIPWINPNPDMPAENLTEDHADEMSAFYE